MNKVKTNVFKNPFSSNSEKTKTWMNASRNFQLLTKKKPVLRLVGVLQIAQRSNILSSSIWINPKKLWLFSLYLWSWLIVHKTLRSSSLSALLQGSLRNICGNHICIMEETVHSSWLNWIENALSFQESIDHYKRRIDFCPQRHSFICFNHTRTKAPRLNFFLRQWI